MGFLGLNFLIILAHSIRPALILATSCIGFIPIPQKNDNLGAKSSISRPTSIPFLIEYFFNPEQKKIDSFKSELSEIEIDIQEIIDENIGEDGLLDDLVEGEEDIDDEDRVVAFAHIFPGGVTEHTVIQFTREGYDDFGYTVELEPLSGRIVVDTTVRDWDDRDYEIPEEGPELDS